MSDDFREGIAGLLPRLRAFARSLARDRHAADDLVQDTVVLALRAQAQFTPGTDLRAWLFTIMHNRFRGLVGRRRVALEPLDQEEADRARSAPPAQEAFAEVDAFRRAFRGLGWAHREALVLAGVHGLSYEEIARVCGCEVGTVKSRLSRARGTLKDALLGEDLLGEALPRAGRPPARQRRVRGGGAALPRRETAAAGEAAASAA